MYFLMKEKTNYKILKNSNILYTENLKTIYKDIRNYLAGRVTGATRDEPLLRELIKIIYCKIQDERNFFHEEKSLLIVKKGDNDIDVYKNVKEIFSQIKIRYPLLFDKNDEINLDPASIKFILLKLKNYSLSISKTDPVGDAFEIFMGNHLKGAEGQFFTKRNVINLIVEIVAPKLGEINLDPACGSGGFLSVTINYLKNNYGDNKEDLSKIIESTIFGIDKDLYLSELAKKHIAINGNFNPNIFCANSLDDYSKSHKILFSNIKPGTIDNIMTNPPFGSNIDAGPESLRKNYDLCYKWEYNKESGNWEKTSILRKNTPPQVLFIEKCLRLLKNGGKLGIILPESIFSSNKYRYVVNYIKSHSKIMAILSMPEELFKTTGKSGTHTKTCVVILERMDQPPENYMIFMADAKWCGHDSRGLKIPYDDLPKIIEMYRKKEQLKSYNHLGFNVELNEIKDLIFVPKYYNPEVEKPLNELKNTHYLPTIQELTDKGIVSISTGDEIGKLSYGTGNISFIRSSDISNWEIKVDPKHCISEEIYNQYKEKQDVKERDILLVKDGTYLIGTPAMITKYDTKIIYQSHIFKIRVEKPDELSPYLLLAALSSDIVQNQIKSKRFSQDIIDSLGKRLFELVIPIPKDETHKYRIISDAKEIINSRTKARQLLKKVKQEVTSQPLNV